MNRKWLTMLVVFGTVTLAYASHPLPPPYGYKALVATKAVVSAKPERQLPPPHPSLGLKPVEIKPEIEEVPYSPDDQGGVYVTEDTEGEPVKVVIRRMTSSGRLVRIDGPTYNWPGCGNRWCMMCLGIHLRSSAHGEDYQYLNSIGSNQWITLHDNLHNGGETDRPHSVYGPGPTTKTVTETETTVTPATPCQPRQQRITRGSGVQLFSRRRR